MKPILTKEQEYVIDSWSKHFSAMQGSKLAIYGTGQNTKAILDNFTSDNIVGLMGEVRTGETESIYGKRIITIDEAVALGVDTIIIVARASNVRIIYRRISDVCAANSINIYDISGKTVRIEIFEKSFEKYTKISEEILKDKIDKADVVSFDVFDTLIMRRVLYPRDIFELTGRQLGDDSFNKRRIKAEIDLYQEGKNPNINEIYERIGGGITPDIEIQIESQYLMKREAMAAILQYARKLGKTVYLVSDMYLPKHIIKDLLEGLEIQIETDNILVSCDYCVSKPNGLFDVLRSMVGAKKILHIGDNFDADIESARRYGIDDTFHIESSLVMLEDSYASEILNCESSLTNHMLIGEFVCKQLNNPFLFSKTGGKISIDNNYEMAYSLIAPFVYCLFGWLIKQARELQLDRILLQARDGYIFKKIYDFLQAQGIDLPVMEYFYTSRTAAVLAGIINEEDILHATRLFYNGKIEDMLKLRFGLSGKEIFLRNDYYDMDDENYILLHRDAIMRHAEAARKKYKAYIEKLCIPCGTNVGFFDFMSRGTCQKALSNFVDFSLIGLYFAFIQDEVEYKSNVRIIPMLEPQKKFINIFERTQMVLDNYPFLESIITSNEPMLSDFDAYGNPIFMKERRTTQQLQNLQEIHTAILDYIKNSKVELNDIYEADLMVPNFLLKLIQEKYSQIGADYFKNGEYFGEFINNTRKLQDFIK